MNKQHIVPPEWPAGSLPVVVPLKGGMPPCADPLLEQDMAILAGTGDGLDAILAAETVTSADVWLAGQCSSTFDVAWELVALGHLGPWGAVVCSSQRQGRGQMRRLWHSPPGNLYVSFLLPNDPLFKEEAAAVLVGYMLAASLDRMGYGVFLKWPNDLVTAVPAKVGGLLLEERDGLMVAGLGLNLACAPKADSMRQSQSLPASTLGLCGREGAGEKLFPLPLWLSLVSHAKIVYDLQVTGELFSVLMQRADSFLAMKGREIRLVDAEVDSPCLCVGLGPSGGLVLANREGTAVEIFSGSVFL